jgi:predicted YcjX-like family ATPase
MTTAPWYAPYVAKASGWLSDAASLADMAQGSTVNLAVTGLSRSGKTVFITSLIHNLLSAIHNPNRMPLLGVVANNRLMGTRLEEAGANRLPRFRYQENIEAMAAGAPVWPEGTDDLREIGIEVRFYPANAAGKLLSEISGSPAALTIRIVDYPGEWLLDLPLLGQ